MKNKLSIFLLICLMFCFIGCTNYYPVPKVSDEAGDISAPKKVKELKGVEGDSTVLLSWINPTDEDFKGVEISCEPPAGTLQNPVTLLDKVQNFMVTGLTNETKYKFIVKSIDESFNKGTSSSIEKTPFVTIDLTAPNEVTNFRIEQAKNKNATLRWQNPNDEDFYGVEISSNPANGTLRNPIILLGNANSILVTDLTNNTEYSFTIRTVDISLNKSNGIVQKATIIDSTDFTPPSEVTNIVVNAANSTATLNWQNPSDEDFYGVQISCSPSVNTMQNSILITGGVNSFIVYGLTNGADYQFTLKTLDKSLNISNGIKKTVTPIDTIDKNPPSEVSEFSITAANSNATLSWENPTEDDFFGVEISCNPPTGTLTNSVILPKEANSFFVSGLMIDEEYRFTIKTLDNSLNISNGKTETATPLDTSDKTPPSEVSNFTITDAKDEKATLTWENPTEDDFLGVEISCNPPMGTLVNPVIVKEEVNSLLVFGLTKGEEYEFTIKTLDVSLNISNGSTKSTTIIDTTDVTPPNNVTNLKAINNSASVFLTWEDSDSDDVYGYQVSWNKDTKINRSAVSSPLDENSLFVAPKNCGCCINNLKNGEEYEFTVKTIDTNQNSSSGVSVKITPTHIPYEPVILELTPSTTEPTNQNVVVSVNVIFDENIRIDMLAYRLNEFTFPSQFIGNSATSILTTKQFTVLSNGTYTVGCQDSQGRYKLEYITIDNIDTTRPNNVENLTGIFDSQNQQVKLNWSKPTDTDINKIVIQYGIDDVSENSFESNGNLTTCNIDVSELLGGEYTFSAKFEDEAKNQSYTAVTTKIYIEKPQDGVPSISSITLDRQHLSSIDSNKDIGVTITGYNFNELQELDAIKVGCYNSSGTLQSELFDFIINKENNTGIATITAPSSNNTYYVKASINDEINKNIFAKLYVTNSLSVNNVNIIKDGNSISSISVDKETEETYVDVYLSGNNLNLNEITMQFYNVKDDLPVGEIVTINHSILPLIASSLIEKIKVPQEVGQYKLKIKYGDTTKTSTFFVYGDVEFTSFSIPKTSIKHECKDVYAVIYGSNFTNPENNNNNYIITCDSEPSIVSNSKVQVINDNVLSFPLRVFGQQGDYEITVKYKDESITQTLHIEDPSDYNIGDVILKDGSILKYSSSIDDDYSTNAENAVAVICGFRNGIPIGIGLNETNNLK